MEFIEIPHFTELVSKYLSDEEYAALQWYLATHPDAGDTVAKTGGARKIRWHQANRGKRGGIRAIYYYRLKNQQIWMLTLYAKNEKADLSENDKRVLKAIIDEIKR